MQRYLAQKLAITSRQGGLTSGCRCSAVRHTHSLALLEQNNGILSTPSLSTISAAGHLKGSITALVAGSGAKKAAEDAATVSGVHKVIFIENPAYDKCLADTLAPLWAQNIKNGNYTHVLATSSSVARDVVPRLSALLNKQPISDVINIQSEDTFVRPIYAGNIILTLRSSEDLKILILRGSMFGPCSVNSQSQPASVVEGVDLNSQPKTEWLSENLVGSERPDLGAAKRVVSGGRGLKSKQEFQRLIIPLADALDAAVGASRAAVDSGFADNSLQVGQTGKNVAPELYLSVAISGAIQHLSGMKDSKVIAAINKDADAPIFQVSDVGLVGDLFELVPKLTERLKKLSIS